MKNKLLLALFICCFTLQSFADVVVDGIRYAVLSEEEKTCSLDGASDLTGSIIIPDSVLFDGVYYKVTLIKQGAFRNNVGIEEITLNESLKNIERWAFGWCTGLKTIYLNTINGDDFGRNGEMLGAGYVHYPFSECPNISKVVISDNVKRIPGYIFYNLSGLTSVEIPENVEEIGDCAFYGTNITEVTIPNNVTSIGQYAFSLQSLTKVTFDTSKCKMNYAFVRSGLTEVVFNHDFEYISEAAFAVCTSLENFNFPDGLKLIQQKAFYNCQNLKSAIIPSSVTSVKNECFYGCSSLEKVVWSENCDTIANRCFGECASLSEITIPENMKLIDGKAFYGCSSIKKINIPENLKYLGSNSFEGCSSLTEVEYYAIDASKTYRFGSYIDSENAFANNPIEKVIFGDKVEIIPESCFANTKLTSVEFPESLKEISYGAFDNTYISEIRFPDNVEIIGGFSGTLISELNIPDKVGRIEVAAFSECPNLSSVEIPNTVTGIRYYAFSGCQNLTEATIGTGARYIQLQSFSGCKNLKRLNYYAKNAEIQYSIGTGYPLGNITSAYESLEDINIGIKVEAIPIFLFDSCQYVKRLNCYALEPPKMKYNYDQNKKVLMGFDKENCVLHVPVGKATLYSNATEWQDFKTIIDDLPIPEEYDFDYTPTKYQTTPTLTSLIDENYSNFDLYRCLYFADVMTVHEMVNQDIWLYSSIDYNDVDSRYGSYPGVDCQSSMVEQYDYYEFTLREDMKDITTPKVRIYPNVAAPLKTDWIDADTRFHLAYRTTNPLNIAIGLFVDSDNPQSAAHFSIGNKSQTINGQEYPLVAHWGADGEWSAIDMSMAELAQICPNFTLPTGENWTGNLLEFYPTGEKNQNFSIDAVYFYNQYNSVDSVRLNTENITLKKNEQFQLTATVYPENAKNKSIVWSSQNEGVATVSQNGLVTAVGEGTTIVTANCGYYFAMCVITVIPDYVNVDLVALNKYDLSLLLGDSTTLVATVYPENATDKSVTWFSSNNSVAAVDGNGKVTAVALGEATITATAVGGAKAECKVTVNPIASEGVVLDKTSITLLVGEEEILIATVLPENATDKSVLWSSSNPNVATVNENGKVKAIAVGTATITAKNGGNTATCEVTVNPILAEIVSLSATELSLQIGQTATITASVLPENATDKTITWSSSNNSVATVDSNGKVTAVALGEATITATAVGGAKAECKVTVNPIASEGVVLDKTSITLLVGEEDILIATVLPENATDKSVTWTSSNPNVATVVENGKIKAIAVGTATITAKNGGNIATCEVTVNPILVESIELNYYYCELEEGEAIWLEATVLPENATNKEIEWSSSDEDVVKVSEAGYVTFVGFGDAVVTATAKDGSGVYATCVFTNIDGIQYIYTDESISIFTLDGKKVQNAGKGIYIVNGKKLLK